MELWVILTAYRMMLVANLWGKATRAGRPVPEPGHRAGCTVLTQGRTVAPVLMLLVAVAGFGQEQQQPIQDLNLLIGKQVTVQRMPLCQPGTYKFVLAYAGKQAKVVSLKPSKIAPLSQEIMDRLEPEVSVFPAA